MHRGQREKKKKGLAPTKVCPVASVVKGLESRCWTGPNIDKGLIIQPKSPENCLLGNLSFRDEEECGL